MSFQGTYYKSMFPCESSPDVGSKLGVFKMLSHVAWLQHMIFKNFNTIDPSNLVQEII